jgi:transcriptional regulator with XRE-family HTH domain
MGTNAVQRGPTAATVAANVKRLREQLNLGLRALAQRLADAGRPLTHTALDKIERGTRRVDVDDLMALAAALDISPATLLMPAIVPVAGLPKLAYRPEWDAPAEVTGLPKDVDANTLWMWLTAQAPPRPAYDDAAFAAWAARSIPAPWLTVNIARANAKESDRGNH